MKQMKFWRKSRLSESHANLFANGRARAIYLNILVMTAALLSLASCSSDDEPMSEVLDSVTTEQIRKGLTTTGFPTIDGSDSTTPLRTILACHLFGLDYEWTRRPFSQDDDDIYVVMPKWDETTRSELWPHLKENNTHNSFVNLIDGTVELILTARSISRDEKKYAEEKGVNITEKPIATDAFVFIVNPKNPVKSLTKEQIRAIYTKQITNWKEMGGNDAEIHPYVRNANSGSQEKFETVIMKGIEIPDFPEMQVGLTMMSPYYQIKDDVNGIGFTPYYYYNVIVNNGTVTTMGVDGIRPSAATIYDGTYPYITDVYASVRSDIDKSSKAYELFRYLNSPDGRDVINESKYIPYLDNHSHNGIEK